MTDAHTAIYNLQSRGCRDRQTNKPRNSRPKLLERKKKKRIIYARDKSKENIPGEERKVKTTPYKPEE